MCTLHCVVRGMYVSRWYCTVCIFHQPTALRRPVPRSGTVPPQAVWREKKWRAVSTYYSTRSPPTGEGYNFPATTAYQGLSFAPNLIAPAVAPGGPWLHRITHVRGVIVVKGINVRFAQGKICEGYLRLASDRAHWRFRLAHWELHPALTWIQEYCFILLLSPPSSHAVFSTPLFTPDRGFRTPKSLRLLVWNALHCIRSVLVILLAR